MAYLLASILSSTIILVLFRWMQNSTSDTRHAIVVNYLAAAVAGALLFDIDWSLRSHGWFWPAAIEGVGFYLVFRMIALTTQRNGITVASIATKMSVVIPTMIGIIALGESVSIFKVGGLICGLLSVFLAVGFRFSVRSPSESDLQTSQVSKKPGLQNSVAGWLLPLLVFVGTGLIDASFKLFQIQGLTDKQFPGFVITIFGFAFITAFLHHLYLPNKKVNKVSSGFGIALGLANLGTVYFILKALALPGWESSIVYPLNNFGIVLASTLVAIVFFGERLTLTTKLGFGFALSSIVLLYVAS